MLDEIREAFYKVQETILRKPVAICVNQKTYLTLCSEASKFPWGEKGTSVNELLEVIGLLIFKTFYLDKPFEFLYEMPGVLVPRFSEPKQPM